MIKKYLNRLFIDGLSGMAYGLFSTLIIGTIICQIGSIVGDNTIGQFLTAIGSVAKTVTGAGIGVGVACKLKSSPLTTVCAAVCGMVGAFPNVSLEAFNIGAPGEPLGAFIAAYVAIEVGYFVSGKTKLEIILTPLCCILAGCAAGYFVGPYISTAMKWLGQLVNINVDKSPIIGGIGYYGYSFNTSHFLCRYRHFNGYNGTCRRRYNHRLLLPYGRLCRYELP